MGLKASREVWAAVCALRERAYEPFSVVYRQGTVPAASDPGWGDWRHRETGEVCRLIQIHGPFGIQDDHDLVERCDSGWVALDKNGWPYLIDDAVQSVTYEEL